MYRKKSLVHREESNYYSILRITRVSSAHGQLDRNLPDSLLSRDSLGHSCRIFARDADCVHRVTQGQQGLGFTYDKVCKTLRSHTYKLGY
jgi:hypothetical protein